MILKMLYDKKASIHLITVNILSVLITSLKDVRRQVNYINWYPEISSQPLAN